MRHQHLTNSKILKVTTAGNFVGMVLMTQAAHAANLGSFTDADTNHDGCVSLQEFETYETARLMAAHGFMAQKFQQMTPQEQSARLQAKFGQLNASGNGCLNPNEWSGS